MVDVSRYAILWSRKVYPVIVLTYLLCSSQFVGRWSNLTNIDIFSWVEITKYQGIVGCTSTNVPLWEIPIKALHNGYLWLIIPKKIPREHQLDTMGETTQFTVFVSEIWIEGQRHKHQPPGRNCSPTLGWEWQENPWVIGEHWKEISSTNRQNTSSFYRNYRNSIC